jgi:hypothetical protein|tara:strand:- start:5087 stop:5716 length:630 start_codon:yes stop_codon:yes gene_type:complete
MPGDKQTLDFKTAGMKRAAGRDAVAQKGKQFGISNFFGWAMQKYPKMTLGQLEARMPSLEREYGQEKTMRKAEPDMKPSVNSAFDDEKERKTAQGIATEAQLLRIKQLAGLPISEDISVEKDVIGHTDDEPDMIRKELFKLGKYSVELYKMLGELPNADFPHWWQAKVVKAGQYLSDAKHYLESELNAPEPEALDQAEQEQDDINPSGV